MPKNEGNNSDTMLSPTELLQIIGRGVEELCQRQGEEPTDNSKKKDDAAELLKLVQLLEKYVALREKITPVEESEAIEIDYALLRNYLERKNNHAS